MRVFVAGAQGCVGTHLVPVLLQRGFDVVGGARRPRSVGERLFDLDNSASLRPALAGCDVAIYLVHGLERPAFSAFEAQAATAFGQAAGDAGVRRVVYLGGVLPRPVSDDGRGVELSAHLAARQRTGVLLAGRLPTLELRAGVIVAATGASFRLIRDVAARCPVVVDAPWLRAWQEPIGIADVTAALATAVTDDVTGALDLPGPDRVTAAGFLELTASLLGHRVRKVPVQLSATVVAGAVRWLSRADPHVVAAILASARGADHVAVDPGYYVHHPELPRTPLVDAIRLALIEEEATLRPAALVIEGALSRLWKR